jgi:hypothetical protein
MNRRLGSTTPYRRTDDIDGQPVYRYESSPPATPST